MPQANIRFYAELNDFLPTKKRQTELLIEFADRTSIKHIIESIGVPHPEIDLILVNGCSVDFSHQPKNKDQISVYPVFESFDITPVIRLRPEPLRQTRFILDTHLGKLAAYLRLLGFDTAYKNDFDDEDLVDRSNREKRIILTRDRGLLKRCNITHAYFMRSWIPNQQVIEVVIYFDLLTKINPFSRCLECNHLLQRIDKKAILDRLHSATKKYYDQFQTCTNCDRIYWKGSHFQRMNIFIQDLIKQVEEKMSRLSKNTL